MLLQQFYNAADAMIVGRFAGKEALSAVGGGTGTIIQLLVGLFVGLSSGATVVISQYYGAGDRNGCVKTAWNGFYFGAAVAALLAFLLPLGGKAIIEHNGHNPLIARYELEYFIAMAPCAGLTCMETAFFSFFFCCRQSFLPCTPRPPAGRTDRITLS